MRMFKEIYETRKLVRSLNTTFLVMILKNEGQMTSRTIDLLA